MSDAGQPPKIIVDSDWKAQAQKEREKLAEKERAAKEAAEKVKPPAIPGMPQSGGKGPQGAEDAAQPTDFQALIGTLATQALMYMGAFPDPETGRAIVSLEHARFHIDLLSVLEEKTKGNLTPEEKQDLDQATGELRTRFVEIVQAIAQMKKEGKLKPQSPGGVAIPGAGGMGGSGMYGPGMG
ncbi:MAG: DUF1844 domain-containing protein [Phycisphaerales bacterium]|nr:DUF1844 domain-containing protein [Phycisphaerales bacterium]